MNGIQKNLDEDEDKTTGNYGCDGVDCGEGRMNRILGEITRTRGA
jgi:hypothetical protein